MKKRFFKFISTAIAAAVTATSFSAFAFAAQTPFSDVPEGSKNVQAFNELYALDILVGYEDGTVRPDNLITRAEVTKLVVAMMGPSYTQQAEHNAQTEFVDVPYSEWYSGYVNVGVANNFINGNGDGTFTPDDNVTYDQIVKMIVSAMGYGTICEKRGGWPNGFLSVAAEIGVTNGVNASGEQAVTRAQVAQLIDNGIKLPIVAVTGYSESALTGQLVAQTKVMDDIYSGADSSDYQTLLTKNHNTYSVKGRVNATRRSDSSLKVDEVRFSVENAKNFDDRAYGSGYLGAENIKMTYKKDDAQQLLFAYVDALIREDEEGDFEILSMTPYGSSDTVTYDASLYESHVSSGGYVSSMDVYVSNDTSKTKTYRMAPGGAEVYVNGVEDGLLTDTKISKYIDGNDNGTITLIDQTESGKTTTDGKIDTVVVTYYDDAIVDSVITQSSQYKIYFKNNSPNIRTGSLTVDPEDDDISVRYSMAGREMNYTEIEEDDVLTIAYDVTGDFRDSDFYEVYVSRSTVTGRVTSSGTNNNDETYYTINGADYMLSSSMYGSSDMLTVGSNYELHLNNFGRIAYFDEDSSSKVIGVVDYAHVDSSDTPKIRMITTSGTKVSYSVRDASKELYRTIASKFFDTVPTQSGTAASGKHDIQYRVAEYIINSRGYITNATPLYAVGKTVPSVSDGEYRQSTNKLGSYSLSNSTVIVDVTDNTDLNNISKISVGNPSQLTDGNQYSAYFYERSSSDSTYRYVLLTGGSSTYNANTNIAVYSKGGSIYDDVQGGQVPTLMVYEGGSDTLKELRVDSTCNYLIQTLKSNTKYEPTDYSGETLSAYEYEKLGDVGFYAANDGSTVSLEAYEALGDTSYYTDAEGQKITVAEYNALPAEGQYVADAQPMNTEPDKYIREADNAEISAAQYSALPAQSYYQSGAVTITPSQYDELSNYGYYVNAEGTIITVEDYEKLGASETKYISKTDSSEISEAQYMALQDKSNYVSAGGKTITEEEYELLAKNSGYKGSNGIIDAAAYAALPQTTAYVNENGAKISIDEYMALPKMTGYVSKDGKVITEEEYAKLSASTGYVSANGKRITEAEYNALPSTSGYKDAKGNVITESAYNALPLKAGYFGGKYSISEEEYAKLEANSYYQRIGQAQGALSAAAIKLTTAQYNALPARSGYVDAQGNAVSLTMYEKLTDDEKAQYKYTEGQDAYMLVAGKDAYTYVAGKSDYTYAEGKDLYTYEDGKSEYAYKVGRDAYTKVEGQDAYAYVEGQDAYTYNTGKDAYKVVEVAGHKDEYTYESGKADYSYVEGQDAYKLFASNEEPVITYTYLKGQSDYTLTPGKDAYSYVKGQSDYQLMVSSPKRGSFDPSSDISQTQVSGLSRGDIFVYDTDSDNYVTEVVILFNSITDNYSSFKSAALNTSYYDFDSNNKLFSTLLHPAADWLATTSATKQGKVDMIFGPIIDKNNRSITVGVMKDYGSFIGCDEDDAQDYAVVDRANIYTYNYDEKRPADRLSGGGNVGMIQKSSIPSSLKRTGASGEKTLINLEELDSVNFIVAKVVDDDITEALVILGE